MKIGRFRCDRETFFGVVKGNKVLEIKNPFSFSEYTGKEYLLKKVKILSPVIPSKVIAVGLNYRDHAKELRMKIPDEPIIFLKPPTAVIGPEEDILLPPESKEVHYEGEMAVVIGKTIYRPKNFKEVESAILGYTCFNDVTARDLQRKDGQWTRSKSFNTFAPLGPVIETELDPTNLRIETKVNGEIKQSSSTKELIFNVFELVKFISNIMTLLPGDLIATGTPPGVGALKEGDVVEIFIEGIGILKNGVRKNDT
ncbi:MAG: 2-keto-4-pentenoate hydratase/2-oxohepta-3-ene-1 [Thermodesulfobacterium sp.]|uniref:2-keto-4-pentenoate hydratase/2-oxohepta-3-ene-1 n=1 Tax=Candidatus Thermodesulfobacterium syntrophicum TaxID=3060442 RepID=A0AAE3P337_9BACT|nr:2-keto-4-pentenoate hydratase/2-oxohepta-3-ene-1 [Candidatus Thermodesulfobacterium syntrophicum]